MNLDWYMRVTTWIIFWIAFWQTLFVLAYTRAPWFRSAIGRALMLKGAALAAIFDIAVLTRVFGENYPGRYVISITVFALVGLGSTYQAVVVIRTQRQAKQERHSHGNQLAGRDPYNNGYPSNDMKEDLT